jgi:hypothetical protein
VWSALVAVFFFILVTADFFPFLLWPISPPFFNHLISRFFFLFFFLAANFGRFSFSLVNVQETRLESALFSYLDLKGRFHIEIGK